MPPSAVILSVLGLALLCTAAAYLLCFYLIPAFGLVFGVLFLGEPVEVGTFVRRGIILMSVALVTGICFGVADRRVSREGSVEWYL